MPKPTMFQSTCPSPLRPTRRNRLRATTMGLLISPLPALRARAGKPGRATGVVVIQGRQPGSALSCIATTVEGISGAQISQTINATDSEDALNDLPSLRGRKRYVGDDKHAVLSSRASGTGSSARSLVSADAVLPSNLLGFRAALTPRWALVTRHWRAALAVDTLGNSQVWNFHPDPTRSAAQHSTAPMLGCNSICKPATGTITAMNQAIPPRHHLLPLLRRARAVALALLAAAGTLAAQAHDFRIGDVVIDHPYALAGSQALQFKSLRNTGAQPDRLLAASSPGIQQINLLHGGQPATAPLAPGAVLDFRHDSGWQLALQGLPQPLAAGAVVRLTLRFERAGEITVPVTVVSPSGRHQH